VARHKECHAPPALIQDTDDLETRLQKARAENQRRYTQILWDARAVMRAMQGVAVLATGLVCRVAADDL
jgi:hypothetical protein